MNFFNGLIVSIISFGAAYLLYQLIKNKPDMFSTEKISHSFTTMGNLALILILAIGSIVMLLKQ